MLRLRYLFILTFCIVALIPMLVFWMWPYSKALESEVKDVEQRHLVIAKNLAGAFERYYQDVTGVFSVLDLYLDDNKENNNLNVLFSSYGFKSIMLVSKDGQIKKCLFKNENNTCPKEISKEILNLAKKNIHNTQTKISTVTEDKSVNTGPILLVVKKEGDNFALGYLSTSYIVQMGKRVAFGKKGHAAVVDQEGNVIAHPLDSWIAAKKNISKVSAVQKMLEGKTGVELFYSPALKGDMIAGYTVVANAKWGVMVPQPLKELENKAKEIDKTVFYVMILGLLLAIVITIPISFFLIKPLERLSCLIKSIEQASSEKTLDLKVSKFLPLEIKELKTGFLKMMENLHKNEKAISHLAYMDTTTNLPNRNYFYESSKMLLEDMKKNNQKGSLVFIDLDGFKQINDTYGHRAGDELLELFSRAILRHFGFEDKIDKIFLFDNENLPNIVPARLSGDEFVILFRNIKDEEEIKAKLEALFKDIFTTYKLYNEIDIKLTGSAGIAMFPKDGEEYTDILRSADIAMYKAKTTSKNTIKFF